MPILFDRKGNKVNIPDEQVAAAIASGQYAFGKGQTVTMKGPAGEVLQGPAEEVPEMLRRGFAIESTAERKERELQEEYGGFGGQAATAALAAGRVLSFGGTDWLASELGLADEVKKLRKANPDTDLTFELGTLLGSFLIPGGQAGAIAKLTKLPRGVAKIGRTVEKATLKGLGGAKGGLVRQALAKGTAMGTGAGVEGAIWNAGNFLSEAALGDVDATAENLLAHMKMGAMWGGAAGMGLGSGGEILRRGLGMGANFAKRSSKSIANMYQKATGNVPHPKLAMTIEQQIHNPKVGAYAKFFGPLIGQEPKTLAKFTQRGLPGKRAREIGMKTKEGRDIHVTALSDDADKLDNVFDKAQDQMRGTMKIKNMQSIKNVQNDVAAMQEATAMIDDSLAKIDEMLAAGDDIAGPTYSGAVRSRLKSARKTIIRHQKKLAKVADAEIPGASLHGTIDSMKRDLQKYTKSLKRIRRKDLAADDVYRALDDMQEGFRLHLEKPEFYGAVGTAQGKFNPVWSRVLGRDKATMARKIREKVGEEAFQDVYLTNRGGIEHMINDMGRARNKNLEEWFLNQIDDKLEFIRLTRDTFEDLPASLVKSLDEAETVAKRLRQNFMKAKDEVTLQNQMSDIIQKSTQLQGILPMGVGAGLGYALGGEEGLALGLGLSVFANPGRLIQIRAALDRMAGATELNVIKSIKGYINKATGKVKPTARKMLAPASLKVLQNQNWGDKRTKDKTRYQAFERRSKELTEFLTNAPKAMERINRNVGDVEEAAPNVATAMKVKAVQAARYLYDKMPKPIVEHTLLHSKFKPSDLELAKFERIAAVIDNPENALKSLKAGMLTVEEVDALAAVYPKMYERIVTTIAEQVPELQEKLPIKEQNQLKILFGVAIHPTHEPDFAMAMAALDAAPPVAPGEAPGPKQPQSKVATGDYDKLSIDTATMTDNQKVEVNKLT